MTDAVIEFAKWVIQEGAFQSADLDGLSIQEKALELGLLTKTNYDPEKHGEDEYAEPGSDWYVFSNLLTQTVPSPAPEAQQEAVVVSVADIKTWRAEWMDANDPQDGTDCVTPFDKYLYTLPTPPTAGGGDE